jgi:uncharacterized membrane-anchored protein YitT (DUF2179 family)
MNPLFQTILESFTRKRARKLHTKYKAPGKEEIKVFRIHLRTQAFHGFLIICGVLSAGLGLKSFLLPNGFIDGGVTGISLLLTEYTGISLPLLIVLINLPLILLGFRLMDRVFALKTLNAILFLALALYFIPYPVITSDKLLVAVFGGFFLGAGIGLAVRGGSVIDGTEILALSISKRSSFTIGDIILIINIMIFSVAAFTLSLERALYSMLTYFSAAKTIDFIINGIEEYTGVTIISSKSDDIRRMITNQLGRGVTIYKGKGGYGSHGHQLVETDIIFSVMTRLEIASLKAEVEKIDQQAFLITHSIKDTRGGMIKKRTLAS